MAQIKQQTWQESQRFEPNQDNYNVIRDMLGGEPPFLRVSVCRFAERIALDIIKKLINTK